MSPQLEEVVVDTRSVYERYNIVADRDLEEAARKVDEYLARKQERAQQRGVTQIQ